MSLAKNFDLIDFDTPVVYADGTAVYDKLSKTYARHNRGFYILAPSGAGKTHFVDGQKEKHWIDGDILWMSAKAHPDGEWWLRDIKEIIDIERRSEVITVQAMRLGFWIVGTDNFQLTPDAVVIPPWSTHKKYIRLREQGDYDGGATSEQLEGLLKSRRWIARHAKKGVPKFNSVSEAANYLADKYKRELS